MAFTDPVKLVIVYHWKKLVSVNVKQELIWNLPSEFKSNILVLQYLIDKLLKGHPWNEYWGDRESLFHLYCEGPDYVPVDIDGTGMFEEHIYVPEGLF